MNDDYLFQREASQYLKLHSQAILVLCKLKILESYKRGGRYFISKKSILKLEKELNKASS